MSSLRKNVLTRGNKRLGQNPGNSKPLKWSEYYDEERDVKIPQGIFHIYTKGKTGPVVMVLHGGGYSALTWALVAKEIVDLVDCQILALDLRGHGKTVSEDESDLSLDTLTNDVIAVLSEIYGKTHPPLIVVGHSMGGAVAVEVAVRFDVSALVVVDVVEGTALESLSSMQAILRGRPSSFETVEEAIRWCYRSGMTHNLEAARVSVPGQIKNSTSGELAASEFERGVLPLEEEQEDETNANAKQTKHRAANAILEEDENGSSSEHVEPLRAPSTRLPPLPTFRHSAPLAAMPPPGGFTSMVKSMSTQTHAYMWRIDLSKTEQFWNGWFRGLSQKFLEVPVPKVLLMANIHGLDTTLTLGQMQGKFQMQVLARSGHAIHEDQPQQVAEILGSFLVKQKLTTAHHGFNPMMPAC